MSYLDTDTRLHAGPSSGYNKIASAAAATVGAGAGANAGPAYTVLRIKRKATDAPLSSLVIQDLEPRLRAKRRRDVSGRPRGVFRLAETVPDTWVGKGREGEVLKTRIQGLLASSAHSEPPSPLSPPAAPTSFSPLERKQYLSRDPNDDTAAARSRSPPSTKQIPPENPPIPTPSQPKTQFRVVPRSPPLSPRTRAMLPPRLMTNAETESARDTQSPLVFVDAQAVSATSDTARNTKANADAEEDKDVAVFSSMLEEYLRLEKENKPVPLEPVATTEDEWVYDLYYRDIRTASLPLSMGVGDGVTIGQLLGYEDISPPSSISGSEPEDEADEDSNEEDYYRNDYPEDEDADEDMDGFRVAGEDEEEDWSESDGDGAADERGEWDYR